MRQRSAPERVRAGHCGSPAIRVRTPADMGSNRLFLIIALSLVLGGGSLARLVQTGAGAVSVSDVRFKGKSGQTLSALLYVPEGATRAAPAPAVLAIHGYIN